jgi:hypothetical protein
VLDGKLEENVTFYLMTSAEVLISELSEFDVVISIENIRKFKSRVIYQITTEVSNAYSRNFRSVFHKFLNYLSNGKIRSLYLSIRRIIKVNAYYFSNYIQKFHISFRQV